MAKRDIDNVIHYWVGFTVSPEEAIALVDEEVKRENCFSYAKRIRDRIIRILFARKDAVARVAVI